MAQIRGRILRTFVATDDHHVAIRQFHQLGSLRRFNALFRERYRLAPTQLRRDTARSGTDGLTLALDYRPPYAWDAILQFLRMPESERILS